MPPVLIGAAPDIGAVEWGTAGAGGSGGSAGTGGSGAAGGTGTGGAVVGGGGAGAVGALPEDDGGCGCRTVRSDGGRADSAWVALLGLAVFAGRRRRE
jgi:MYXO-CTERM domain-containing protein